ncbi:hypothetical protein [Sphingobacterium sp. LRF_L2]|uniref:hypothetical protein n=1 Tax=Sphingobacterium sp. LRF_L2 TaxID=3369421 RepID=UPI003F6075D0
MNGKNYFRLVLLLCIGLFAACKKYEFGYEGKARFSSFVFEPSANPNLTETIAAVIEGENIYIRIPNVLNVNQVVPSFEVEGEKGIAYVNNVVQQSGVTAVNLSDTVQYRIATENDMGFMNVIGVRSAAIIAFGFYAADNEGILFKDYLGKLNAADIAVDLPVDADITKLVARFTTTAGATVRVNGVQQTSASTENDFTEGLVYEITDEETVEPETFHVLIGRLTAPEWMQMNIGSIANYSVTEARMTIDPTTDYPVIIFSRGSSDGDGTRKAVVSAFDGTAWNYLGDANGISGDRVDASAIAVDDDGVVYAAYKDYFTSGDLVQYASVQRYVNGAWSYVGPAQSSTHRVNYLHLETTANKMPVIGYTAARAEAGAVNRSSQTMFYSNDTWTLRSIDGIATNYFSRIKKGRDNKLYYVGMDMTPGTALRRPTVYRFNDTTLNWELVGTALISPSASIYGAIYADVEASETGEVYVVFQSQANTDKKSYVMKYSGGSWRQIGAEISHTANSSAQRDNIALALHPNGTLYFAHSDANGLKVTTFDENTQNWTAAKSLTTTVADKLDLRISNTGIPYITTVIDGNVAVFKYDIP